MSKKSVLKFGQFIDDISEHIDNFDLQYRTTNSEESGHEITIQVPPSTRKLLITEQYIGLVKADSPEYHQLIKVMVKNLKSFNNEI